MRLQNDVVAVEDGLAVPQKITQDPTWSSSPTPGAVTQKNRKQILKRYLRPHVHGGAVRNGQNAEATAVATRGRRAQRGRRTVGAAQPRREGSAGTSYTEDGPWGQCAQ